ncbi:uncharacterized protein [Clytia hemisphaerica]|uniref:uncharacterized protein n=1 Tax=Clytia hemisphaerica TaxID=252671 RepID=UPI0034D5B028
MKMFSINDGWGTGEEQDILVSKLFDKPNSVDRINNNKKKKKQKNKGNINKQDADGSISKEPDQAKPKKNANGTNNSSENENFENKNNEENIENPGLKKKKNKKRKLSGDLETTNTSAVLLKALDIEDKNLLEINAENTDIQTIKKKKKKKEKRKSEENNNILEHSITIKKTGIDETSVINNGLDFNEYDNLSGDKGTERDSKKKKKKSKKNRDKDNNSEQRTEKIDTETGNINSEEGDAKDLSTDDQEKSPNIPESKSINSPKPNDAISKRLSKFQQKMNRKLEGGHFRYINEKLYTTDSHMAVDMFKRQPSLFDVYHKGFESQVLHWPENPVDLIIEFIKEQSEDSIVIDFGCGNAKIGRSVPQKVHSFDLVAVNDDVTVADMKNVPVKSGSADIAVFSLALMGTNVNDFIAEANRTLKISGHLKIAEVKSRFKDVQHFIDGVISHGFDLLSKDDTNKMFIMFDFEKTSNYNKNSKNDKTIELKPCIYKRR